MTGGRVMGGSGPTDARGKQKLACVGRAKAAQEVNAAPDWKAVLSIEQGGGWGKGGFRTDLCPQETPETLDPVDG